MIHTFYHADALTNQSWYFLLDVESGSLHTLDKSAFDVAYALENKKDPYQSGHDRASVDEILAEFAELKQNGMFDAPLQEQPDLYATTQVVKAMCLHVAHDCNLRCKYCFASTGEFHGERMLMSLETGKEALDFLIAHSGERHHLEVDLFGGEPLMNYEVVKGIVAYGRELEKKHNKTIRFTITTNGLALTKDKIEFLNDEMHNVVLSLDGRKEVHDQLRPTKTGTGSYDAVLPQMQEFVKARREGQYYVRGTFTNLNLDFTKDVAALREAGFEQISIEPVVLEQDSPYAIGPQHVDRILAEYDKLSAYLENSKANGNWFNFFHFMLDMDNGPCLKKRIIGCGAGNEYVAVTPDGDIYPCHQFVGDTEFLMGNVHRGELDQGIQKKFQQCSILTKPSCQNCWAKYFCSGGCAANAWKTNGDLCVPDEITCKFEKKRTECAIALYAINRVKEEQNAHKERAM